MAGLLLWRTTQGGSLCCSKSHDRGQRGYLSPIAGPSDRQRDRLWRGYCPWHETGAKLFCDGDRSARFAQWVPYPGQLRLQAFSHLASGATLLSYWHWHSIHNAFETYWKGLLSHDFAANPTYLEAKTIG